MILSIVHHNDGLGPPILVLGIEVLHQLDHEEKEAPAISLTSVDSVIEASITTDSSNQVDQVQVDRTGLLILFALRHPPTISVDGMANHTLINIDDDLLGLKEFNILRSCILPLELSIRRVMQTAKLLHFSK